MRSGAIPALASNASIRVSKSDSRPTVPKMTSDMGTVSLASSWYLTSSTMLLNHARVEWEWVPSVFPPVRSNQYWSSSASELKFGTGVASGRSAGAMFLDWSKSLIFFPAGWDAALMA